MIVETSKLNDIALDWAVAKAKGYESKIYLPSRPTDRGWIDVAFTNTGLFSRYDPTVNWLFCGALVQELGISVGPAENNKGFWAGVCDINDDEAIGEIGDTYFVAICRCYVQYKLGDKIEIPDYFKEIQITK